LATQLIDLLLSTPTGVLRVLKELEELGYDFTTLVGRNLDQKELIQLLNMTTLCRYNDMPIIDTAENKKYAD
jgi:hypothetical protein